MIEGDGHGLDPVSGPQFGKDVRQVVLHRACADGERFGNLEIGTALDEQDQCFSLSFSQVGTDIGFLASGFDQGFGGFRGQRGASGLRRGMADANSAAETFFSR